MERILHVVHQQIHRMVHTRLRRGHALEASGVNTYVLDLRVVRHLRQSTVPPCNPCTASEWNTCSLWAPSSISLLASKERSSDTPSLEAFAVSMSMTPSFAALVCSSSNSLLFLFVTALLLSSLTAAASKAGAAEVEVSARFFALPSAMVRRWRLGT